MGFIYALGDPRTGAVRYIGKATSISRRLKAHRNEKRDTRKCRWLAALARESMTPQITILEDVPGDQWQNAEIQWIAHFKEQGCDLCNHTAGGEGLNQPNAETRAKIAANQTQRMADPCYRAKIFTAERAARISDALKGRPKSAEHIVKLRQNRMGHKLPADARARISQALRGNQCAKGLVHSDETLARLAEASRGNKHALGRVMPEHEKAQRSAALKGRPKSEEWKAKIRGRKQSPEWVAKRMASTAATKTRQRAEKGADV